MQENVVLSLHISQAEIIAIFKQRTAYKILGKNVIGASIRLTRSTNSRDGPRLRQKYKSFRHRFGITFIKAAYRTREGIQNRISFFIRKSREVRKFHQTL